MFGKEPDLTCADHVFQCTLDYILFQNLTVGKPVVVSSEDEAPVHDGPTKFRRPIFCVGCYAS